MRTVCGTILAVALAAATAFADTVKERERRTDEIAQWLAEEPKADGARISDRSVAGGVFMPVLASRYRTR